MAVSPYVRASVLFAWGNKCFYCGRPAEAVDHIVPIEKKGSDDPSNLLSACFICNSNKKNRWLPEPVLIEALDSAKKLADFVVYASKIFEESRKLASDRVLYGSLPLVEGESGIGRDQRAKRILRPARIVAKENAAIVNKFTSCKHTDA